MKFDKMHACGNDYIYLDGLAYPLPADWDRRLPVLAPKLCHRRYGIGADGVVVIDRVEEGVRMSIFNADGTRGATCGNALRCVAWLLHHRHGMTMPMPVLTAVGHSQVDVAHPDGGYSVCMNRIRTLATRHLLLAGRVYDYRVVDVGNRHAVVRHCQLPIERVHRAVTRREGMDINVETYEVAECLHVSVCERGSGVTAACGSGACAVAFAAREARDWTGEQVCVRMSGGEVMVRLAGDVAYLSGEAVYIYEGAYDLERLS